jgi:hypothetical protein
MSIKNGRQARIRDSSALLAGGTLFPFFSLLIQAALIAVY